MEKEPEACRRELPCEGGARGRTEAPTFSPELLAALVPSCMRCRTGSAQLGAHDSGS